VGQQTNTFAAVAGPAKDEVGRDRRREQDGDEPWLEALCQKRGITSGRTASQQEQGERGGIHRGGPTGAMWAAAAPSRMPTAKMMSKRRGYIGSPGCVLEPGERRSDRELSIE